MPYGSFLIFFLQKPSSG